MTNPYRDPAKMSETALMRECNRLRDQVAKLRGSTRRAWQWAALWVCVCGSLVIIQHLVVRHATQYPAAIPASCIPKPECDNGCRTPKDAECEAAVRYLRAAVLDHRP